MSAEPIFEYVFMLLGNWPQHPKNNFIGEREFVDVRVARPRGFCGGVMIVT